MRERTPSIIASYDISCQYANNLLKKQALLEQAAVANAGNAGNVESAEGMKL